MQDAYTIQTNRKNGTRELVEVSTNRVIDQADMDSPRECVALAQRLDVLNAQAAAQAPQLEALRDAAMDLDSTPAAAREAGAEYVALLEAIEVEAALLDTAEAFTPGLALHYGAAPVLSPLPSPAPIITRAAVLSAVDQARQACEAKNSASWFSAVSKAAVELDLGRWLWDGSTLVIGSRTKPGKRYRVTAEACSCGHRCRWHLAAYRILALASAQPAR